ncbi:hypothetical protein [Microlunatus antarcticus]|uniref:Uncharacterized protein n=1 Tax=Microlunatus antarcticus TaxID=53388 RepID=A0A7W5JW80_9ACTN|nr:hypothetical protein [Microlunatus antarcticus]MBB3327464.1 hypothetical protein [Microlunatus antarcticus]
MNVTEEYKTAIRELRAALGADSEMVPVAALNQVLATTEMAPIVTADTKVEHGDHTKTSGSYFVLTKALALIGQWKDAKPTTDPDAGAYELTVKRRSALQDLSISSASGTPWVGTQGQVRPWSLDGGATLTAEYEGTASVTFPMGSASADDTERLLKELVGDLSR